MGLDQIGHRSNRLASAHLMVSGLDRDEGGVDPVGSGPQLLVEVGNLQASQGVNRDGAEPFVTDGSVSRVQHARVLDGRRQNPAPVALAAEYESSDPEVYGLSP